MLAHRISAEAKFQADLDVCTALGVELLSTLEVIAGEASPATRRLRDLATGSTDSGLCDTDFGSDLADSYTCAGQVEDLLPHRRTNRTGRPRCGYRGPSESRWPPQ